MGILSLFTAKQVYIGIPLVMAVWGLWRLLKADPAKGDSRGPGILMLGGGLLWIFAVLFVARMGGGSGYREIPPEEIACVNEVVRYVGSPPRERFRCNSYPKGSQLWDANGRKKETLPKGMLAVDVGCFPETTLSFKAGDIAIADSLAGIDALRPACGFRFGCVAKKEGGEWRATVRTLHPWVDDVKSCLATSPGPQ